MSRSIRSIYALENCFDRRALQSPDGRRKAQLFAAMIPFGCKTVLDAGGGTGWATIGIRNKCHVVTLDSSEESLKHAPDPKILADVVSIPFPDKSFDLVMSSQVLEHLPDDALKRACAEMMRVAGKYLLVSVPYRENLAMRLVQCVACRHIFHRDHHCRAFKEQDLARLFPGWILAEWHVFGALNIGSGLAKPGSQRLTDKCNLPLADHYTVCPACGQQGEVNAALIGAIKKSIFQRVLRFAKRPWVSLVQASHRYYSATFLNQPVAPYWVAGLYIVQNSTSAIDGNVDDFVDDEQHNESSTSLG